MVTTEKAAKKHPAWFSLQIEVLISLGKIHKSIRNSKILCHATLPSVTTEINFFTSALAFFSDISAFYLNDSAKCVIPY